MRFYNLTSEERRIRSDDGRFNYRGYNVSGQVKVKINNKVVMDWATVAVGTFTYYTGNNNNRSCHGGG